MKHKATVVFGITILLGMFLFGEVLAGGSVHVRGHFRKDGIYVQPHYRSAPDGKFYNNWSTKGNINPYTGKEGNVTTPPAIRSIGLPSTVGVPQSLPSVPNSITKPVVPHSSAIPNAWEFDWQRKNEERAGQVLPGHLFDVKQGQR